MAKYHTTGLFLNPSRIAIRSDKLMISHLCNSFLSPLSLSHNGHLCFVDCSDKIKQQKKLIWLINLSSRWRSVGWLARISEQVTGTLKYKYKYTSTEKIKQVGQSIGPADGSQLC